MRHALGASVVAQVLRIGPLAQTRSRAQRNWGPGVPRRRRDRCATTRAKYRDKAGQPRHEAQNRKTPAPCHRRGDRHFRSRAPKKQGTETAEVLTQASDRERSSEGEGTDSTPSAATELQTFTLLIYPLSMLPDEVLGLRKSLGLSRSELSRFLGVSDITVVRWETGDGSSPRGLPQLVLQRLSVAIAHHSPQQIAQLVRSGAVDAGAALQTLLQITENKAAGARQRRVR